MFQGDVSRECDRYEKEIADIEEMALYTTVFQVQAPLLKSQAYQNHLACISTDRERARRTCCRARERIAIR